MSNEEFPQTLTFADESGSGVSLKEVSGVAYSGGAVSQTWSGLPIYVDLAGMEIAPQIPLLYSHANEPEYRLGVVTAINNGSQLEISGMLDADKELCRHLIAEGQKIEWQLSIGASVLQRQELSFDKDTPPQTVNGREISADCVVVTKSLLREVSIVAVGADAETHLRIAAMFNSNSHLYKEEKMENKIENKQVEDESAVKVEAKLNEDMTVMAKAAVEKEIAEMRAQEQARIEKLREITKEYPEVQAKAFAENWDVIRAAAYVEGMKQATKDIDDMRVNVISKQNDTGNVNALEIALCRSAGIGEQIIAKNYSEQDLEQADKMRGVSLKGAAAFCCAHEGKSYSRYSFDDNAIRAAFSTTSLPTVLGNVANKAVLQGYTEVESFAKKLCKIGSVPDFKQTTRVRLTDFGRPGRIGGDGEIKHTSFGEEHKVFNKLYTMAEMISLNREMMYNDDLGLLTDLPNMLGRQMAKEVELQFWELLLSNPDNMFSAGNNNYISGASSALSIDSLSSLRGKFAKQEDSSGNPIVAVPRYLIVPVELEDTARRILTSNVLFTTGMDSSRTVEPNVNIAPSYGLEILSHPYMSHTKIAGNSATAWYLAATAQEMPTFEMIFLNGQQTPKVEISDVDFNRLGMQWRCYLDFGIKNIDYRGWAKSKGIN